jgi:hypothetical protein
MKKKSAWWIWALQAVVLAIPLTWAVWTAVDPSILDSYNKAKVTEQNFWESLILQGNIVANIVPSDVRVYYMTGDGEFTYRDVTVHGYGVKSDKVTECVQFYYSKDNAKQIKPREICISPDRPVSFEKSWIEEVVKSVSKWPIWEKYGKLYNDLGAFGSP